MGGTASGIAVAGAGTSAGAAGVGTARGAADTAGAATAGTTGPESPAADCDTAAWWAQALANMAKARASKRILVRITGNCSGFYAP